MYQPSKRLNDVQRAKRLLKILEVKGELDVYDVMLQYEISYTRAIPVLRLLRKLCEDMQICTYDEEEHKLVSLVKPKKEEEKPKYQKPEPEEEENYENDEEIRQILDAKPEGE